MSIRPSKNSSPFSPEDAQEHYARQREYWQKQLRDVPEMLDLPRDYPRPQLSSFAREHLPVHVNALQTDLLLKLAQQEECTLSMVVLAAWFALLHRYSGQEDLVVGTPIATREKMSGLFVDTLILRVYTGDEPYFLDLLKRVREVVIQAYKHTELPSEQVEGVAHPSDERDHMPLVQVMFAFQPDKGELVQQPGVETEWKYRSAITTSFDLNLELTEGPEGLSGILEYSSELFTSERMQRMIGHLHTLFNAITSNPLQKLDRLPLLTAAEEQLLLIEWNQTQTTYPQALWLSQLIEDQVERTPEALAVIFEEQRLTYRELNNRANQLAHYLQETGVGPDVLVGVCLYRSVEMVVAMLAILKAGGAYVPLDPDYPSERLAFMIADAGMPLVLSQQEARHHLPSSQVSILLMDAETVAWSQARKENPQCSIVADHLAYVIYTSGSTGKPKGVMISQRGLTNYVLWSTEHYNINQGHGTLVHSPLTFDLTLTSLFPPLIAGLPVMLLPDTHDIEQLASAFQASDHLSLVKLTPVHLDILQRLLPANETLNGRTNAFIIGGEALDGKSLAFWQRYAPNMRLINEYGPTETVVGCCVYEVPAGTQIDGPVPIGRPIANITTYILNKALQPLPIGVAGELYLGGEGLARGYLKQPELTAAKFIPHPFSTIGGERLYKTGDLARYLPDGSIDFLGRLDYQVKLRGFRIETGEIETVLNNHTAVCQSVVSVHEDGSGQKRLVAYFVPAQGQRPGIEDLRTHLQLRLPAYMIPAAFVPLSELPLTSNGKIDRKALSVPEQATGSDIEGLHPQRSGLSSTYVPPGNEVERTMVAIWEEYLHIHPIGIHDKFNELGGDSLLILQVISRLSDTFLVHLAIRDFLVTPTIASLAPLISQRLAQEFDRSGLEQLLQEFGG